MQSNINCLQFDILVTLCCVFLFDHLPDVFLFFFSTLINQLSKLYSYSTTLSDSFFPCHFFFTSHYQYSTIK